MGIRAQNKSWLRWQSSQNTTQPHQKNTSQPYSKTQTNRIQNTIQPYSKTHPTVFKTPATVSRETRPTASFLLVKPLKLQPAWAPKTHRRRHCRGILLEVLLFEPQPPPNRILNHIKPTTQPYLGQDKCGVAGGLATCPPPFTYQVTTQSCSITINHNHNSLVFNHMTITAVCHLNAAQDVVGNTRIKKTATPEARRDTVGDAAEYCWRARWGPSETSPNRTLSTVSRRPLNTHNSIMLNHNHN